MQIQNDKRQHITEAMWTGFATVVTIPSVWSHFSFVVRAVRVVKKLIHYYKECSQITNHRLKNIENEQPQLRSQHSVNVTRDHCSNSCWDTNFKAGYETGAGIYKHVYFNTTWQAGVMWGITIIAVISLYECIKYLWSLTRCGKV